MNILLENQIQKNIVTYFTLLKTQRIKWKTILNEILPIIQALSNQMEQFILVEKYSIKNSDFECFPEIKERVLSQLTDGIEDEFSSIDKLLLSLSAATRDCGMKGSELEQQTVELDWSSDSSSFLVRGSACQRPIAEILQWIYDISLYYKNATQNIMDNYKKIQYGSLESIQNFRDSFNVIPEMENLIADALVFSTYSEQTVVTS